MENYDLPKSWENRQSSDDWKMPLLTWDHSTKGNSDLSGQTEAQYYLQTYSFRSATSLSTIF